MQVSRAVLAILDYQKLTSWFCLQWDIVEKGITSGI